MLLGAVQVCGHSFSMTDSDVHDFDRVALWPMIHCCSLKDYMIHLAGKSQISPQKGYGYYSSPTSSNDGMRRTTHLEMTTTTCLATKGTQGKSIGNAIRIALTARGILLKDLSWEHFAKCSHGTILQVPARLPIMQNLPDGLKRELNQM